MAVKEDVVLKKRVDVFVTRICDECGKEEKTRMMTILRGRKRRGKEIDLCVKCSCSTKYKKTIFSEKMEKGVNWTGGLHDNSHGYLVRYIGKGKRKFEHVLIFEKHIGRLLKKEEKLHHIDMDKMNNDLDNLFLCKNRSNHMLIHFSAEECGYKFLNKQIWFDWNILNYVLNYVDNCIDFKISIDDIKYKMYKAKFGRRTYVRFYPYGPGKQKYLHTEIGERMMGRKLFHDECVHHIDGNSLNNNFNNLCVISKSRHAKCHKHLQRLVGVLYSRGEAKFENGCYYLKEIENVSNSKKV